MPYRLPERERNMKYKRDTHLDVPGAKPDMRREIRFWLRLTPFWRRLVGERERERGQRDGVEKEKGGRVEGWKGGSWRGVGVHRRRFLGAGGVGERGEGTGLLRFKGLGLLFCLRRLSPRDKVK